MTRSRRLMPAAAVVLALLGVAALVAAVLMPSEPPVDAAEAPAGSAAPTPKPVPTLAGTPTAGPIATPEPLAADVVRATPIAELADAAWVARVAAAGGIPERALVAYAGAALRLAVTHPGCGIGWNTIAAIGLVESEHGTLTGARIGPDGVASPTILGIPLNGAGVDAIRDTDGGRLDGDTTWDRAVGPMQFIPSSWALLGQDGNGDGVKDVNQIDDAALAAGQHLCEVGGDLTQPAGWITAVNAYNASVEYNNRVAAVADRYSALR